MVRNTYIYPPAAERCGSSATSSSSPRRRCRKLQLDLDLRLPHPGGRGDGRSRAGLHAGRRGRVPPGRASTRASTSTTFAPRLSFFWAIGMNFFMEVAKLRAGRLLWSKLVSAVRPEQRRSRSRCARTRRPAGWSLTAQDVFNNVTRTCIEAMAATQGHTQSLHTNALDEALALPTDFSRPHRPQHPAAAAAGNRARPASSTRGAARTYVEKLTYDLARRAWAHIQEVEQAGGMARAIDQGMPEAAHRGGGRPHPGPHRLRPPAADRRQQVPPRVRGRPRRPQGRQRRRPSRAGREARAAARRAP